MQPLTPYERTVLTEAREELAWYTWHERRAYVKEKGRLFRATGDLSPAEHRKWVRALTVIALAANLSKKDIKGIHTELWWESLDWRGKLRAYLEMAGYLAGGTLICLWLLSLAGCMDQARVFPLDDAAMRAGIPKIEFGRFGIGKGPVSVTMPDGEILKGEYQVTENSATAASLVGGKIIPTVAYGSNRAVVLSATGPRGTIIHCDATADTGGHGSGTCQTNKGTRYRVMF